MSVPPLHTCFYCTAPSRAPMCPFCFHHILCRRCNQRSREHVDGQCLFDHTQFSPLQQLTLIDMERYAHAFELTEIP